MFLCLSENDEYVYGFHSLQSLLIPIGEHLPLHLSGMGRDDMLVNLMMGIYTTQKKS